MESLERRLMMTGLPLVSAPRLVCNIELDVTAEPVTIYEEGDAPSGGGISGLPGYSDVTVISSQTSGTCAGTFPAEITITGDSDAYAVMDSSQRLTAISPPQSNPRIFVIDIDPTIGSRSKLSSSRMPTSKTNR